MLTQEQLDERLKFLTGSDAGVITKKSKWTTPYQLWEIKTGRRIAEDISGKNHIKFGNYMEPGVAAWFADESGKEIRVPDGPIYGTGEKSFLMGNLDYLVVGENAILECKTAYNDSEWGESGTDQIPHQYLMQVAHYCMVGNFDKAYVAVVFALTREMRWYEYEKNAALEAKLFEYQKRFWANVKDDIAPDAVDMTDLENMISETNIEPVFSSADVEESVFALAQVKAQISALQKQEKELKFSICNEMQEHELLVDAVGEKLATWKYQTRRGVPADRLDELKEVHPKVYDAFVTETKSRTFKLARRTSE